MCREHWSPPQAFCAGLSVLDTPTLGPRAWTQLTTAVFEVHARYLDTLKTQDCTEEDKSSQTSICRVSQMPSALSLGPLSLWPVSAIVTPAIRLHSQGATLDVSTPPASQLPERPLAIHTLPSSQMPAVIVSSLDSSGNLLTGLCPLSPGVPQSSVQPKARKVVSAFPLQLGHRSQFPPGPVAVLGPQPPPIPLPWLPPSLATPHAP